MGGCNLKRFVRLCCGAALAIALLTSTGCAPWRPFEAMNGGEAMSWFPTLPDGGGAMRGTGLLPKAREIERNLGL